MQPITTESAFNKDGKGWVHCDQETCLKYLAFQEKVTRQALRQLHLMQDAVKQRRMKPFGSLSMNAAPCGTGITIWDEDLHEGIEVSLAINWPERI
jgi:hypothetical protein